MVEVAKSKVQLLLQAFGPGPNGLVSESPGGASPVPMHGLCPPGSPWVFPLLSRRTFIRSVLSSAMVAPLARSRTFAAAPEVLYNGITLGTPWPPRRRYLDAHPVPPPYLQAAA